MISQISLHYFNSQRITWTVSIHFSHTNYCRMIRVGKTLWSALSVAGKGFNKWLVHLNETIPVQNNWTTGKVVHLSTLHHAGQNRKPCSHQIDKPHYPYESVCHYTTSQPSKIWCNRTWQANRASLTAWLTHLPRHQRKCPNHCVRLPSQPYCITSLKEAFCCTLGALLYLG